MPNELIKNIRAKYPQYSDIDDVTLAKKIVAKYPVYAKDLSEFLIPEPQPTAQQGIPAAERLRIAFAETPEQQIQQLESRYGAGNVINDPQRGLMIRRDPRQQFEPINPTGFDVGDIAEQAPMLAPTLLSGAGAVAGGVAGPGGSIAGSGLGFAAGEQINKAIGRTVLPSPKKTVLQDVQSVAEDVAVGMAGEGLGQFVLKTLAPMAKKTNVGLLRTAEKLRVPLMPDEVVDSPTLRQARGFSASSITGGGTIRKFEERQARAVERIAKEVAESFGKSKSPQEIGFIVEDALKGGKEAFQETAEKAFGEVARLGKDVRVDITPIKRFAAEQIQKNASLITDVGKGGRLESATLQQFQAVASLPNQVSWETAVNLKQQFGQTAYSSTDVIGNRFIGASKKITSDFDAVLKRTASEHSLELYAALENANEFYKYGKKLFNEGLVKNLLNETLPKTPEKVIDAIIKPNAVTQAARTKSIIMKQNPETWQSVKRGFVDKLFNDSMKTTANEMGNEVVDGARLLNLWEKYGERTLRVVFNEEEYSKMNELIRVISKGRGAIRIAKGAEIPASLVGQFQAAGFVSGISGIGAGLATGDPQAGLAAAGSVFGLLVIPPKILASLLTSSFGRRYLSEGLRLTPGTKEAIRWASRFPILYAGIGTESARQDATAVR